MTEIIDWLEDPTIKELMSRSWGDSYTAKVTLDWTDTTTGKIYPVDPGISDTATITGWYGTATSVFPCAPEPVFDPELMDWCDWFVDKMGLIFGKLVYFIDRKLVTFVNYRGRTVEFPRPIAVDENLYLRWRAILLKDLT